MRELRRNRRSWRWFTVRLFNLPHDSVFATLLRADQATSDGPHGGPPAPGGVPQHPHERLPVTRVIDSADQFKAWGRSIAKQGKVA